MKIELQIKNMLSGLKLFEKFQEGSSQEEFVTESSNF